MVRSRLRSAEALNTFRRVERPVLIVTAMGASLLSACTYRAETLPRCFDEHIGPSLRAVKEATDSGAYRGGVVELRHTFCSTHDDRLGAAEKLLAASGYLFERHIDEVGHCTDVSLKSPLTQQALRNDITTFCGIAATAGVAYRDWSGSIGDRFLYVARDYVSLLRRGELPKPN
ncbi:MAG TPA: hypothetical protein VF750_07825 [Sphingomicrobium sp.]